MRVGAAACAIALFSGCKSQDEPAVSTSALPSAGALLAADHAIEARAPSPAIASALLDIHGASLPISPNRFASQRLAFGRGMLGMLEADHLVIQNLATREQTLRMPLKGGRALLALPTGALLAIDTEATYRVDPGATKPHAFKRVVFFPNAEVLPERSSDRFFWVVHRVTKTAVKYRLETTDLQMLPTEMDVKLEGFDGQALAMSRDGVFVYSTAAGIARRVPGGKVVTFARPAGSSGKPIWRLLLAKRLDQLWVLSEDGDVELWTLIEHAPLAAKFRLAEPPYEVAATPDSLLEISIDQERGKARRFTAWVYDNKGAERFHFELPSDRVTPGDDWLETVTRNKGIAASEAENRLAVGGPSWLGIWDIRTGARLNGP